MYPLEEAGDPFVVPRALSFDTCVSEANNLTLEWLGTSMCLVFLAQFFVPPLTAVPRASVENMWVENDGCSAQAFFLLVKCPLSRKMATVLLPQ